MVRQSRRYGSGIDAQEADELLKEPPEGWEDFTESERFRQPRQNLHKKCDTEVYEEEYDTTVVANSSEDLLDLPLETARLIVRLRRNADGAVQNTDEALRPFQSLLTEIKDSLRSALFEEMAAELTSPSSPGKTRQQSLKRGSSTQSSRSSKASLESSSDTNVELPPLPDDPLRFTLETRRVNSVSAFMRSLAQRDATPPLTRKVLTLSHHELLTSMANGVWVTPQAILGAIGEAERTDGLAPDTSFLKRSVRGSTPSTPVEINDLPTKAARSSVLGIMPKNQSRRVLPQSNTQRTPSKGKVADAVEGSLGIRRSYWERFLAFRDFGTATKEGAQKGATEKRLATSSKGPWFLRGDAAKRVQNKQEPESTAEKRTEEGQKPAQPAQPAQASYKIQKPVTPFPALSRMHMEIAARSPRFKGVVASESSRSLMENSSRGSSRSRLFILNKLQKLPQTAPAGLGSRAALHAVGEDLVLGPPGSAPAGTRRPFPAANINDSEDRPSTGATIKPGSSTTQKDGKKVNPWASLISDLPTEEAPEITDHADNVSYVDNNVAVTASVSAASRLCTVLCPDCAAAFDGPLAMWDLLAQDVVGKDCQPLRRKCASCRATLKDFDDQIPALPKVNSSAILSSSGSAILSASESNRYLDPQNPDSPRAWETTYGGDAQANAIDREDWRKDFNELQKPKGRDPKASCYLAACERLKTKAMPDVVAAPPVKLSPTFAGSTKIRAEANIRYPDNGLTDKGLFAIIETLSSAEADVRSCEVVDLSKNHVSDSGMVRLLKVLETYGWTRDVQGIDISSNKHVGPRSIKLLISMLTRRVFIGLRVLRVGGIELPDGAVDSLMHGLSVGASGLGELDLSYTQLGKMSQNCCGTIAGFVRDCSTLKSVDISGNFLRHQGFDLIGEALAQGGTVEMVRAAHNTAPSDALFQGRAGKHILEYAGLEGDSAKRCAKSRINFSAVSVFCEHMQGLPALQLLDLRSSELDEHCALVAAAAFCTHKYIETLLLGGNSLGYVGIGALIKYVVLSPWNQDSNLRSVDFDMSIRAMGCHPGDALTGVGHFSNKWQPTLSFAVSDPSGSYALNLDSPQARAQVKLGLRSWDAISKDHPYDKAFLDVTLDGNAFKFNRDPEGGWLVPQHGFLSYTLLLPQKSSDAAMDPGTLLDPEVTVDLNGLREFGRIPAAQKQLLSEPMVQRLSAVLARCEDQDTRFAIAQAVACDFVLEARTAWRLCTRPHSGKIQQDMVGALINSLVDPEKALGLLDHVPRGIDYKPAGVVLWDIHGALDFFCGGNAAGRYSLELACPMDRMVLEHLLLINRWEVEGAKALRRPDISQRGNYQMIRNEVLSEVPFNFNADWQPPNSGLLEFDFTLVGRPGKDAKTLSVDAWDKISKAMVLADVDPIPTVLCLKKYSYSFYVSCSMVKSLIEALREIPDEAFPHTAEIPLFTAMFFRIKDWSEIPRCFFGINEGKVEDEAETAKAIFSLGDLNLFRERLGRLALMDASSFWATSFMLKLNLHEDRQICRMLILAVMREGGKDYGPESVPICAIGPREPELYEIRPPPETWGKVGPPLHGCLHIMCQHHHAPDHRYRRDLIRRFCGLEMS